MPYRVVPVTLVLAAGVVAVACSNAGAECTVGADCASGVCSSSGKCLPPTTKTTDGGPTGDAPTGDGSTPPSDASHDSDGAPPYEDDAPTETDGGAYGCQPSTNGILTRAQIPMTAGLHADFLVAENVTVDSAGTMNADGSRTWDFSASLSGDHNVTTTTDPPTGQWYSSKFPDATYTTTLGDTSNLIGVFQATGGGLLLQGIVSPTNGQGDTEVSYSPPAAILAVPMQMGFEWNSNSNVTGTLDGFTSVYTEAYSSTVDAHGTLKVPYGTFTVLRVYTLLTRVDTGVTTYTQTLTFLAACFGPVATITSNESTNEPTDPDFTTAAEIDRLAP
jgi:hypothetical protein